MPENREAADVYMICRNQIITAGMGQILDINLLTVFKIMDEYPGGIEDRWKCLNKVRSTFHYFLKKEQEEHDEHES